MAARVSPTRKIPAGPKLRDFDLESAAELGRCTGAQSFRAVRRSDGTPVLLHKFRPASSLLDLGPVIKDMEPPDFAKPFVTRFTGVFGVAGSAWLIEPLPACVGLADVWRAVLLTRPQDAFSVAAVLLRHLFTLVHGLGVGGRLHGALILDNIVLSAGGSFGMLTASAPCTRGRLWLRKEEREPVRDDFHALAGVLRALLDIEVELAYLRNTSMLLQPAVRDEIGELADAIGRTRLCVGMQACSRHRGAKAYARKGR
jgi:hypothetical protein